MCSQASDMDGGRHGGFPESCLGGRRFAKSSERQRQRLHDCTPARCRNRVLSVSLSYLCKSAEEDPAVDWTTARDDDTTKVSDEVTTETRAQREREKPC